MADRPNKLHESPSQTAGPYVHIGCMPNAVGIGGLWDTDLGAAMITGEANGERITVTGTVFDGEGTPVLDAMVELWQADADGNLPSADPGFTGWGRRIADLATGEWTFETIRPGGGVPYLSFWIAARGINLGLATRMYFPDADNAGDPVLSMAGARAATLIALQTGDGAYRFDIHLQGERETVFFEV